MAYLVKPWIFLYTCYMDNEGGSEKGADEVLKERLLTTKEAAAYLGYHPEYLRELARTGQIRARRTGHSGRGVWRFAREDLDAFASPRVYQREADGR